MAHGGVCAAARALSHAARFRGEPRTKFVSSSSPPVVQPPPKRALFLPEIRQRLHPVRIELDPFVAVVRIRRERRRIVVCTRTSKAQC